jgi:hypothetical protein
MRPPLFVFRFPGLPWDQQASIIDQWLGEHQTNIDPDTDEDISHEIEPNPLHD